MLKRVSWKYFAIKTKLTSPRIFLWMDSYSNISSNFWPHPSGFWRFRMRQKEPPKTFEMTKVPLFKTSGRKNSFWDYSILLTIWKIWLLGAPEEWHISRLSQLPDGVKAWSCFCGCQELLGHRKAFDPGRNSLIRGMRMLMTKLEYIFLEIHVALPLFYPPKDPKQIVQLIGYHTSGAPNKNIVQNHLNIALLNVFQYFNGRYRHVFIP